MKTVILAGGKGTRIASITSEIPKALIPVNGIPVLEHQVIMARDQGFGEFIFIIGHLGSKIREYFGTGEKWGVSIATIWRHEKLGHIKGQRIGRRVLFPKEQIDRIKSLKATNRDADKNSNR